MTKRDAIRILVYAAAKYQSGSGTGIRSIPTAEEKTEIKQAIVKVWPDIYKHPVDDVVLSNLGVR